MVRSSAWVMDRPAIIIVAAKKKFCGNIVISMSVPGSNCQRSLLKLIKWNARNSRSNPINELNPTSITSPKVVKPLRLASSAREGANWLL